MHTCICTYVCVEHRKAAVPSLCAIKQREHENDLMVSEKKIKVMFIGGGNEASVKTKMWMYHACVLSQLLYGSETWTTDSGDLAALEAFQNNRLRRILRSS